jgi:hypothetical protein
LGVPDDPVPTGRLHRGERPRRRPFQARWLTWSGVVVGVVVAGAVAVALSAVDPRLAVAWLVVVCPVAVAVRYAWLSLVPWDEGVQVYEDVGRLDAASLPAGSRSSQLFVPYGLFLGWCVRRGLVNDWFRTESGGELDELAAGRLSGPQLYAWWGGVFASDMLTADGRAFARRHLWSADEPHGRLVGSMPVRGAKPFPRPQDKWFFADLRTLAGTGEGSAYLLPDTPDTAAAFDRLADARLARWRRWRLAFAFKETERANLRRQRDDLFVEPD